VRAAAPGCRWSAEAPAEWAALEATAPLFARRRWLEAMGSRIGDRHRWLVASRGDEPLAGLYATVLDRPTHALFDPARYLFGPGPLLPTPAVAGARASCFPCLLCMLPGYECYPVGPDAGAGAPDGLDALVAGAVELAREERMAAVACLFVGREPPAFGAALAAAGFAPFPMAWRSDLVLPGAGMDDYLSSLGGHRRREVLRERRRLRDAGVTVRDVPLAACAEDVVRLRGLHQRKYGHAYDEAGERRRLALLAAAARDEVTVLVAEIGGRVVALTLHVWDGEVWHAFLDGVEYGVPAARLAYFETSYYAFIEAAYAAGRRRLSYGYGAEQGKLHRGCRPEPVDGWALALDPAGQADVERAAARLRAWEAAR